MSGVLPLIPRPMSPWRLENLCPCCRRHAETPRLLSCLHSVCTPCLNKVETLLRKLEKKRGSGGLKSPILSSSSRASLQPLGKFLCPQCNNVQVISRLGITVLPPVKPHSKLPSSPILQHSRKTASPTFNNSNSPSSPFLSHSRNTSSSSTSDKLCSFHFTDYYIQILKPTILRRGRK